MLKYLQRFLWWCSGAKREIIEQHPSEHSKYFGIGGTVLFTALMAMLAGGYAFKTAFDSNLLAVIFGLFWGTLIFNLDRYIVSTFGSGDGKKTISWGELASAAPRLIMAVFLGIVISTPLEVKIFEKEIDKRITEMMNEDRREFNQNQANTGEIEDLQREINELDSKIEILRKDKNMLNVPKSIEKRRETLLAELTTLNNELDSYQKSYNTWQWKYTKLINAEESSQHEINGARESRNRYGGLIKNKQKEISTKNNEIHELDQEEAGKLERNEQSIESEIEDLRLRRESALEKLNDVNSTSRIDKEEFREITKKYNGLMGKLEALDSLCYDENGNVTSMWWSKWLIMILFILIEISPILFKMMIEEGPYDYTIRRMKHEAKVKELQAISNMNEKINFDLKIHKEKNESRLNEELKANEELLKEIALAQLEVAKVSVEQWKQEQIRKKNGHAN